MKCNEIAAIIHADMVNDDSNGYSWEPRHGEDGKGVKTLTIDGKKYSYDRGAWDCSSSVIKAWSEAIKYTPYKGKLDGATYTGNMRSVFVHSGLFEWKPMSFIAARGDLYLNEANHVAMCQSQDPDVMSEFCINENGEVYGGAPGDQTGGEAAINPFREEFDGILHYNGKADNLKHTAPKSDVAAQPRYRIWRDGKWQAWHSNGSTAGYKGHQIYDVDFSGLPSGSWWRLTLKGGKVLAKNKHNDARKVPISGIEVYYKTANPSKTGYYEALYRVYAGGKWLKWEHDVEDGGAGDDRNQVEKIQFKVAKC
jgi:hypothetical protein